MAEAGLTLDEIIDLAKTYARSRDELDRRSEDIRDRQRKAVRPLMKGLRHQVAEVAQAKEALEDAIDGNAKLFDKPRTQVVDGIKFGMRKQIGQINIADQDDLVAVIRKTFPRLAKTLVRTKSEVNVPALRKLPAGDLARLGVTIDDPVDKVTIDVAASDVDKLVDALLLVHGDEAGGAA